MGSRDLDLLPVGLCCIESHSGDIVQPAWMSERPFEDIRPDASHVLMHRRMLQANEAGSDHSPSNRALTEVLF